MSCPGALALVSATSGGFGRWTVKALVVIDMLDDFVDGALANPRARAIVAPLQRILEHARREGWVVVFSNDAHQPGDPELKVWGEHAMAGSPGAQVISELLPQPGERELISPSAPMAPLTARAWMSSSASLASTRWCSLASTRTFACGIPPMAP